MQIGFKAVYLRFKAFYPYFGTIIHFHNFKANHLESSTYKLPIFLTLFHQLIFVKSFVIWIYFCM